MYFKDTFATQYFKIEILYICYIRKIHEYKSLSCFVEKSSLAVSAVSWF